MPLATHSRLGLLLAFVLAVLALSLACATAQVRFPLGNDGIGYISEASNLLQGKGLVRGVNETASPDLDFEPGRYHPPGFGLAIAGTSALGLSAENAAIALSRAALGLLPFALMFGLRPVLPVGWALAATALTIFSPSIYLYGATVNADTPTLLLIVLATGLIIRGCGPRPRVGLLIVSGFLLGIAYVMRNSVTATFAGLIATFAGAAMLRQMSVSSSIRNVAWILAGSAPVIGLLVLRNYLVFGEPQPYVLLVGKHASLLESFRVYLHGLIWDITASPELARILAWNATALLLTAMPALGIMLWGLLRYWRNAPFSGRFVMLYGLLFSVASAGMLVIAHTYHGLDFGFLLRHMMQYAWILYAVGIIALLSVGNSRAKLGTGLVVGLLLASRLWFIANDLLIEREMQVAFSQNGSVVAAAQPFLANGRILTDQIKQRLAKDDTIPNALRDLPPNALILSNQGPLLGYLSGRPVRMIPFPSATDMSSVINRVAQVFRDMHTDRPVYIAFVPDNRLVRSSTALEWQAAIQIGLPTEYQLVAREVNLMIVQPPSPSR